MKFSNWRPNKHVRPRLGPCMSFAEALQEFGVTKPVLMQALGSDKNAPKPRQHHRSSGNHYDAYEMRTWWARRTEKQVT